MYFYDYMNMTPEERKIFFILMGFSFIVCVSYGIYCFFKNDDKKQ